jgi:hypothetical protein
MYLGSVYQSVERDRKVVIARIWKHRQRNKEGIAASRNAKAEDLGSYHGILGKF